MTRGALVCWAAAVLALGAAAGLAVIYGGLFDIRASSPHSRIVTWALHTTMQQAVRRAAGSASAPPPAPAQIRAGFAIYDSQCVSCHGGPGVARAPWVAGMNPSPPYLIDASRQFSPAGLKWLVANGVKMTGMPAWSPTLSSAQLDDVVAFLRALPTVSPAAYAQMRAASHEPPAHH